MNNSDYPAFPLQPTFNSEGQICNESFKYEGVSKREYFAAKAMQSVIMLQKDQSFENDAELAVKYADALLAELEKPVVSNETEW